jgi:hypothetical protein
VAKYYEPIYNKKKKKELDSLFHELSNKYCIEPIRNCCK